MSAIFYSYHVCVRKKTVATKLRATKMPYVWEREYVCMGIRLSSFILYGFISHFYSFVLSSFCFYSSTLDSTLSLSSYLKLYFFLVAYSPRVLLLLPFHSIQSHQLLRQLTHIRGISKRTRKKTQLAK